MTQPLVQYAGPCYMFAGVGGTDGQQPLYLGTAEENPVLIHIPVIVPVRNDIGGERPFDRQSFGEEAVITFLTNRWDDRIFRMCLTRSAINPDSPFSPVPSANGVQTGDFRQDMIGVPMMQNRWAFQFWITFPLGGFSDAA